ncbi:protein of unknown function DUF86 [Ignisphaera aggregans DSM 17230]|uniref:Polymerase beta nucleotidyltransferase domain-containing protein n=1 Tax=Ignisphaera aggregans (strain DSM 17230 / JCM 13409 / AQ1.S1) TaxID=583356 RepID=E0SRW1_IGNAA|nr:protein of unknown function DUF86 [Ignisphaera aggregans DSM 17230]
MEIVKRFEKQFELIDNLIRELEIERSYRGIERLVQLVIQALLDLGLMAISVLGGRKPRSYSEIGFILMELGILDESDAKLVKSMAGLRNILVHEYATIDREKIFEFAKTLKSDAIRIAMKIMDSVNRANLDPNEDIDDIVKKLYKVLKGRVRVAYLFGGRSKRYLMKGDYDIAILMDKNYSLYELGELQILIAETLGVDEDKIDLICLNNASPDIVIEALSGIPIIIENPVEILELKTKALTELLDMEEAIRIYGI